MRSVDVVLPASMCAMIPMLRVSSSLNARPEAPAAFFSPARFATASATISSNPLVRTGYNFLPTIMGESLVGFGHAVHIFLLLDGAAACVGGIDQFVGQAVDHGLARTFPRILQKPANRERLPAEGV